jgi:hypothetical protein
MLVTTERGLLLGFQASLIENDRVQAAWAERTIIPNEAYAYLVGKYVEAGKPNQNNHYWSFADLKASQDTIRYSPLNMLHVPHKVVGSFIDTEMVYPTGEAEAKAQDYQYLNPYVEALAVMYRYYFPSIMPDIRAAHEEGSLFISMECVAETVSCIGPMGCEATFEFAGVRSDTYCAHINSGASVTALNKPHFLGGALIIPPVRPGWQGANVDDLLAAGLTDHKELVSCHAQGIYESLQQELPHLDAAQWEYMMAAILSGPSDEP